MIAAIRHTMVTLTCFAIGWLAGGVSPEAASAISSRTAKAAAAVDSAAPAETELDRLFRAAARASGPGAQIKAALDLAAAINPADFHRALIKAQLELPAHSASALFTNALVLRWTKSDPAAAAHWCLGNTKYFIQDVVRLWAEQDPTAARAFLDTLPAASRREATSGYAEALADTDPAAAMAFLRSGAEADACIMALRRLAQKDPHWLLEQAESLPASGRTTARAAAGREMAKKDLSAALAWAISQPDQSGITESIIRSIKDPGQTMSALMSLPAALQQSAAENVYIDHANASTMLAALRDVSGPSPFRDTLLRNSVYNAMQDKPSETAANLQTWFPDCPELWAANAARAWAGTDPTAAMAWVKTLPEAARAEAQQVLEILQKSVAAENANTPLDRVLAKMEARKSDSEDIVLLSPDERTSLLQDPTFQTSVARENILSTFGEEWPEEYAHWLASQPQSGNIPDKIQEAAHSWSREEPAAAAAWVESLAPGEVRTRASTAIASQWATFDPTAAARWVQTLPAGPERDKAMAALESAK